MLRVRAGLDFARRRDFFEVLPPQSYQPFAPADALLGLGLARQERRLVLVSRTRDPLFAGYFRNLGRHIGSEAALGNLPARYQGKSLAISKSVAERIKAERLNILTEHCDPQPQYDLAVVTNVLVYFNNAELLLALSNIHSMLREGGYLIHNEPRVEVETFGRLLGLLLVQGRTLRLTAISEKPLFDSFVIHRK